MNNGDSNLTCYLSLVRLVSMWNTALLSPLPTDPLHPLPPLESSGAGLTRAVLQLAALACVQEHKACQWRTAVCQPFGAKGEGGLEVSQRAWEFEADSADCQTSPLSGTNCDSPFLRLLEVLIFLQKEKKRSVNFPSKVPAPVAWVWAGLQPVTHIQ